MKIKPQHIIIASAAALLWMKYRVNKGIGVLHVVCNKCGWKWNLKDGGKDPMLCHHCGHRNNENSIGKIEDYGNPSNGRIDAHWGYLFPTKNLVGRSFDIDPKDISPEHIAKKYNLGGLEYGNWMSQEDRVNHTAALNIALADLAKCLKISQKQIGQNGFIYIAMGARGKSKAAAHYEPGKWTINLTKFKGAGSLAHEYGHCIDNLISFKVQKNGKFNFASGGRSLRMTSNFNGLTKGSIPYIVEEIFDKLYYNENGDPTKYFEWQIEATDYYKRRTEVFARLTESIVFLRMQELGIKNKYLQDGYAADMPPAHLAKKVMPLYFQLLKKLFK